MALLGLESNLQSIIILIGAFAGNFVAGILPYWKARQEFREQGLEIVFDNKFLGTMAIAAITSFVIVSGAFNSIFLQIDPQATIIMTFISAATLGYGLNRGLNAMMPSPNQEQKEQVIQIQERAIIDNYENEKKLQSVLDVETSQQQGQKDPI
jgi:hypothetical protein